MPDRPMTGRSLVTRRAIVDIIRGAVLGSYGVTGVDAGPFERLLGRLGLREPGIKVRLDRGLEIDLHLTVAYGVPVAEVARQVDSAVRYGIRRALDREVRRLAVHVGGLRYQPASVPPGKDASPAKEASSGEPASPTDDAAAAREGAAGPDAGASEGRQGGRTATVDPAPPEADGAPDADGSAVPGRVRRGGRTNRRIGAGDGRHPG